MLLFREAKQTLPNIVQYFNPPKIKEIKTAGINTINSRNTEHRKSMSNHQKISPHRIEGKKIKSTKSVANFLEEINDVHDQFHHGLCDCS
jgi:hypothetical protein